MESFPNEARVSPDGSGPHRLSFNYATAVAKPDPLKRSRIVTSQSVGAWVKFDQYAKVNADTFETTKALSSTKCVWRDWPCQYQPQKAHFTPSAAQTTEDIWRLSSGSTTNIPDDFE